MRALSLDGSGQVALIDAAVPAAPGECLVRVRLAGICGTDLQMIDGYADYRGIFGHEFVGVVERSPSPEDAHWVGKRVVGEINVGCRACAWCRAGVKEHCEQRTVLGIRERAGSFAEYLSLPAANLHHLPDAVEDRAAVFVEPVAAACRIFEQVPVLPDARVAVLGDGRMGILTAQVLRTVVPAVTLIGRHDRKLAVARSLGIEALQVDGSERRFDLVVDATGRADGLAAALTLVRPLGTIVLKSTTHGETATSLWPVVVHEVTVVGSRCGPFARAVDLLASGAVSVLPLIAGSFTLDDYDKAFEAARRELKVLFTPDAAWKRGSSIQ
jgi:threonine dehydrogenase-like Zn-dependent dehydrogenase